MSTEFNLPELGENISSGDVVNVLVREGQEIAPNQGVVELETEKAVVEIPCPQGGKIAKIHVKKGDRVKVGQLILTLDGAGTPAGSASAQKAPAKAAPREEQLPVETRPAVTPSAPTMQPAGRDHGSVIPAGPAARRLARELGVDLRQLEGTGNRGRITPEDVREAATGRPIAAAWAVEPVTPPGEPGSDSWGPVRRERMSQIRRAIAAQMARSSSTIPHVTNFDDADVTDLDQLRRGVPEGFLGPKIKLTMMPLAMRAVAMALRRHPMLNASLDEKKEEIVYKQYINLGVAVDTPRGLIVPVIRNADRMSIGQLAAALATVAERARSARFAVEELRGGTFTLSNLGAVGGTYSTPVINHPEVAILLLGRSRWMPVVRDDRVQKRLMLPLSLSYDHRVVDGATAARFLNDVIGYLQSPATLLMGG